MIIGITIFFSGIMVRTLHNQTSISGIALGSMGSHDPTTQFFGYGLIITGIAIVGGSFLYIFYRYGS